MPNYVLFLHDRPDQYAAYSPEDMQRLIEEYSAWSQRLAERGKLVGGEKLRDEGARHVVRSNGTVSVTDGPFAEAKEVVGGYFIIDAADHDEAVEIARGCPHLANGRIEVREIEVLG